MKIYLRCAALCGLLSLSACNADGSTDWNAVAGITAGIGAAALGAADIYTTSHTYYYQPVVVCRPWWAC